MPDCKLAEDNGKLKVTEPRPYRCQLFGMHTRAIEEVESLLSEELQGPHKAVVLIDVLIVEHDCPVVRKPDVKVAVKPRMLIVHHGCCQKPSELLDV